MKQVFMINKYLKQTLIILFLAVINLDSALKKNENYYAQAFLKECKYIVKEKIIVRQITEDTENFSSDFDNEQIKTKYHNIFR